MGHNARMATSLPRIPKASHDALLNARRRIEQTKMRHSDLVRASHRAAADVESLEAEFTQLTNTILLGAGMEVDGRIYAIDEEGFVIDKGFPPGHPKAGLPPQHGESQRGDAEKPDAPGPDGDASA